MLFFTTLLSSCFSFVFLWLLHETNYLRRWYHPKNCMIFYQCFTHEINPTIKVDLKKINCIGASGSEVSSRHQKQNRKDGKTQNEEYMTGWAGLL
jgi:hypothetical protein